MAESENKKNTIIRGFQIYPLLVKLIFLISTQHPSTMKVICVTPVVFLFSQAFTVVAFVGFHGNNAMKSRSLRAVEIEENVVTDSAQPISEDSQAVQVKGPPCPGRVENDLFVCDNEFQFWRNFQKDGLETTENNVLALAAVGTSFAEKGPDGLAYWVRHMGRSTYFATNAILGNLGFNLHERLVSRTNKKSGSNSLLPLNMAGATASRLLLETALCYQQDFKEIQAGNYREPWDMDRSHRQSSPRNVLTQTGRFVEEAIGTLGRRNRATQKDKEIRISDESTPGLYPDYYRNAFHYQTDGWMSKKSADVYETSSETLFLGRQDAMQRTSLKPLINVSKKVQKEGRPMRILEVACGTGRFMTFIRDNLPLDTEYTAIDLSPFYLDSARDNDQYWRRTRKSREKQQNGGTTVEIQPARIIQAQAENLPFKDEAFDAVVCLYLFHELPRDVRASVVSEMSRVVAPSGTVVITDSIQRGDRPVLDTAIGNFGNFNEPYYVDYTQDFLPDHFERVGLKPSRKTIRSNTKSLSFTRVEAVA